jgi:pimeloyl-ACP methyl ester carboxylesterase
MISFGYSDKPRIDYSFQTLVEHLAGFIDVMGFEKVNLVGQSQGAYIAAKYTADYPERVNRLAVINTGTLSTAMGIDTEPSPQEGGQNDGSKEALRRSLEFRMYRKEKITDDMLETKLALAAQPGMKEARSSMRAYRIGLENDPNQAQVFSLKTRLPHITVPMCIIWGVEDRSAPVRLGRALREMFPQAEYHEVQEAGHHSFLDQPEVVNDLLIRFLSTAN